MQWIFTFDLCEYSRDLEVGSDDGWMQGGRKYFCKNVSEVSGFDWMSSDEVCGHQAIIRWLSKCPVWLFFKLFVLGIPECVKSQVGCLISCSLAFWTAKKFCF